MTQNDSCRERDDDDEPTCMTDGSSLVGVKVAEERGGPGGSRFFCRGFSEGLPQQPAQHVRSGQKLQRLHDARMVAVLVGR